MRDAGLKVLLISQEMPPETGWGGIGTYVATHAAALARAGHQVHVLSVAEGQPASDAVRDGVVVHRRPARRIPGLRRLTGAPRAVDRLTVAAGVAHHVRSLGRFDVAEAPEWMAEALLAGARPLVVRLHSGAAQVFRFREVPERDRRWATALEDRSVRRADMVIGTRSILGETVPRLGLDPARVREIILPVTPLPRTPPPGEPRVLFAGRFEHRKGVDVLVRAMPAVLARVPAARFVLLGRDTHDDRGGSHGAGIRQLIDDLGVGPAIEMLPWRAGGVAEELVRATVCAVPSRWESLGYVAAEAASAGRAVVASAIPGLVEVVDDGRTGRLVPPDDPAALADALAELLSDGQLAARHGAAGAELIRDLCDPDRVCALTVDAYREAIAGRRADASRTKSR